MFFFGAPFSDLPTAVFLGSSKTADARANDGNSLPGSSVIIIFGHVPSVLAVRFLCPIAAEIIPASVVRTPSTQRAFVEGAATTLPPRPATRYVFSPEPVLFFGGNGGEWRVGDVKGLIDLRCLFSMKMLFCLFVLLINIYELGEIRVVQYHWLFKTHWLMMVPVQKKAGAEIVFFGQGAIDVLVPAIDSHSGLYGQYIPYQYQYMEYIFWLNNCSLQTVLYVDIGPMNHSKNCNWILHSCDMAKPKNEPRNILPLGRRSTIIVLERLGFIIGFMSWCFSAFTRLLSTAGRILWLCFNTQGCDEGD